MEETYTLGLALLDFVPNIAFFVGAYFLVRLAYLVRGKSAARIMAIGTGLIFLGGILKATWKLFYTLQIADIQALNEALFILQAPGFSLMLVSVILIIKSKSHKETIVPAIALWKIPLLALTTLASLGSYGILAFLSFRRGVKIAAWCFILTILFVLGMSGMASGAEQSINSQWIEEGINSVGQISFAVGSWVLSQDYN